MATKMNARTIVEVTRYQCSLCGVEFDSKEDTQEHIDREECGDERL